MEHSLNFKDCTFGSESENLTEKEFVNKGFSGFPHRAKIYLDNNGYINLNGNWAKFKDRIIK